MPGSGRIIERRTCEVNSYELTFRHRALCSLVVLLLLAACAGCSAERRAERRYREAQRLWNEERIGESLALYERILQDYPDTDVAGTVAREIELYRSLAGAVQRYPFRRARDLMIETARALERHRARGRVYPESLDVLVPAYLAESPVDPWGNPLVYRRTRAGRGYTLVCHGPDGEPGGEGESQDLVVRDAKFVARSSGVEP